MKKITSFPLLIALLSNLTIADSIKQTPTQIPDDDLNIIYITRGISPVISPTGTEEDDVETPVSVSVITPEEIKATGANSLVDVLRVQTGVQIKDDIGDGSRATITMRGFGTNSNNNILFVVDGRKLNNPSLEAPLLSSVSLKDIERIEILQGSGGVLFGDQATGGVINIVTKKIDKNQTFVSTTLGTDDLKTYKFDTAQKLDNGFSFRGSLEAKTVDNYRENNEANYDNVFAQLNYDDNWGRIFFERTYVDDDLNTPGFLLNSQIEDDRQQVGFASEFDNIINISRIGTDFYLNKNFTLENRLSIRDANGTINNSFSSSNQDTRLKLFNTKLLGKWNTDNGTILSTTGYEIAKADYQNDDFFAQADWKNSQKSYYHQQVVPITKKIDIAFGGRLTRVVDSNLLSSATNSTNESTQTAHEIGLNYRINKVRYFVRRAKAFRFANADENGLVVPGVDFLKPQTSFSNEAGMEFNFKKTRLNVLLYDLDIKNEIYFDAIVPNPSRFNGMGANVNLDRSNRRGLVLELDQSIKDNLAVGFGYSLTKAKYTSGNHNGNEVPSVAEHSGTAYVDFQLTNNTRLYLDAVYLGERFPDSDDANSSEKLGGYTLINFNLGWKEGDLDIGLRINNMTNKKYSGLLFASGGYPAPERNVEFTLSYQLQ